MNQATTRSTITVLYIEDNIFHRQSFAKALVADPQAEVQFNIEMVATFADAARFPSDHFDVVVSDLDLGEGSHAGISYLKVLKAHYPRACLIVRTQSDDAATLREVLRVGVDDFISKQSDRIELPLRLARAWDLKKVSMGGVHSVPEFVVGQTMRKVAARIGQIMSSALTSVHVQGATGTGKEVVADLFDAAVAGGKPLVRVNCAAIPQSLMESELFGYVKGAFTGANQDRMGLFESANGGWIFLDELNSLPLSIQAAMLRVIENKEVLRVGSNTPRKIAVRILSASNVAIPLLVEKQEFRLDLWQRLSEAVIELPLLNERRDEVPELIEHLLATTDGGPYQMTEPALMILAATDWSQGNVRQLRNTIRAMTEFAIGKTLTPLGIPKSILAAYAQTDQDAAADVAISTSIEPERDFEMASLRLFLQMLKQASIEAKGPLSIRSIAKILNMSRSAVSDRVETIKRLNWVSDAEFSQIIQTRI